MGSGAGGGGRGGGGGGGNVPGINPQRRAEIAAQIREAPEGQLLNTLAMARIAQQSRSRTSTERRNMTTYANLITAELARRGRPVR